MPTLPHSSSPYYGGGQVPNPSNVIQTTGAPSAAAIENTLGTLAVDNANANLYGLCSLSGGTATWYLLGGASMGAFTGLTGDNLGTAVPAPNVIVAGTANQITTSGAASTLTLKLPAVVVAPGTLASTTTLAAGTSLAVGTTAVVGTGLTVTAGGAAITGTTTINTAGASNTTIGTGGTGAVRLGNTTGNTAVTGSLTTTTTLTATLGAITATNGNLVLVAAGNKINHTSVAIAAAAGANSMGTVTLVGGTVVVATTAVTANSLIKIWRQTVGATGAAALGQLSVGTIVAATSFVINAWSAADATALQASDVSVIGWEISN